MASYVSYEVKTGPIYGMETNVKSGNGWLYNFTFKIVFTFDVFLVLKPHTLQGDMYFI